MIAAMKILPHLNARGASSAEIKGAVEYVEGSKGRDTAFARAARIAGRPNWSGREPRGSLAGLSPEIHLALEMISHADFEHAALAGELHLLEAAWKEAEEIASIADSLGVSRSVVELLLKLKHQIQQTDP